MGLNLPAQDRQKSRSRSRSGGIKIRQPQIEVSSNEEDKKTGVHKGVPEDKPNVNSEDVMKMLSMIAGKVQGGQSGPAMEIVENTKTNANADKEEDDSDESEDEEKGKLKLNRGSCTKSDKTEVGIVECMRQRLDHYMEMNGKKIKSLCLARGVKWERKDKSAWELAKQDTDEFTRLVNGEDEHETDVKEEGGEEDSEEEDDDGGVPGN
ncbi:hypothetical protein CBR_g17107 [Chara braunii]|uniref:Uncharacterized protein n=1 Tax=Chara braunii TaxID=69332 RepID=A0A388KUN8_CHABU|nr:hypothetical protein CBR_g17107 [Chara braunii]|eukprot:GBG73767.1 hypothetical protein CBR_g17107 [Chara braunii]